VVATATEAVPAPPDEDPVTWRLRPLDRSEVQRFRQYLEQAECERSAARARGQVNDARIAGLQVLITEHYKINMTIGKLSCLAEGSWLNDEVVNFYMSMLQARDRGKIATANARSGVGEMQRASHYFSSFFIAKLLEQGSYNYALVRNWTKRFDVFEMDKIFFPVNIANTHWTLIVAFMRTKRILYLDSLFGDGRRYLNAVFDWIKDEGLERERRNRTVIKVNRTEWALIDGVEGMPSQTNGFDCAVFVCVNADFVSDDIPLVGAYTQADMPHFRNKIGTDIIRGTIGY